MSKPTAPVTTLMLDKERHLLVNFNTLALIEEKTGKNTLKTETWRNLSATDLLVFLWASLKQEDPDLTIEQVGAMLTADKVQEVTKTFTDVALGSFPEPSGDGEKNKILPTG